MCLTGTVIFGKVILWGTKGKLLTNDVTYSGDEV